MNKKDKEVWEKWTKECVYVFVAKFDNAMSFSPAWLRKPENLALILPFWQIAVVNFLPTVSHKVHEDELPRLAAWPLLSGDEQKSLLSDTEFSFENFCDGVAAAYESFKFLIVYGDAYRIHFQLDKNESWADKLKMVFTELFMLEPVRRPASQRTKMWQGDFLDEIKLSGIRGGSFNGPWPDTRVVYRVDSHPQERYAGISVSWECQSAELREMLSALVVLAQGLGLILFDPQIRKGIDNENIYEVVERFVELKRDKFAPQGLMI